MFEILTKRQLTTLLVLNNWALMNDYDDIMLQVPVQVI